MAPDFTGRRQSNLDRIELEYTNANYISVGDLYRVLQPWGAVELIVISHGPSKVHRGKWPAIACITNDVTDPETHEPSSIHNVKWSVERQQMIRPSAAEDLENLSRRLHIVGVRSELTIKHIEERLAALEYDNTRVAIQAGRWWGTLTLRDEQSASHRYEAYGVQQHKRIFIGNIIMFVNRPGADGGLRCFICGVPGHFSRECRRSVRDQVRRRPYRGYGGDNRQVRGELTIGGKQSHRTPNLYITKSYEEDAESLDVSDYTDPGPNVKIWQ
ncbi:unnamed protein product [Phytophthora fragariaefolia]|uniref:Unnamed protein product n=1 Tax=Phytophthora fragariaefolia TaxID=1490495 RepID=A0A9W6XAE0_9STRA|nr:unnamed protein product [Phytophthora fragariaefolia]